MIPKWRGEHIVGGCEQKHEYLPQKHEDLPGATGAVRELGRGGGGGKAWNYGGTGR